MHLYIVDVILSPLPPSQAFHCSELIGFYVSTEVWSSLVLPAVRSSAGCKAGGSHATSPVPVGPVQCTGCLMTLRGLIRGAPPSLLGPNLKVREGRRRVRWQWWPERWWGGGLGHFDL